MKCPRLDHFVRFNSDGSVSRCGHMVNAPKFESLDAMEKSQWLLETKSKFDDGVWPVECVRCKQTEDEVGESIRTFSTKAHEQETITDYLQVGGVLDNVCNAGCLTCNSLCSTRIGALEKKIQIVDNSHAYWNLPQDRIIHLDINGGEPSYSKNYRAVLGNLPKNLKTLRLNTNCSTVLYELVDIANSGVDVTVTVSLDGIGSVHNLVRWPIEWETFLTNLMTYKTLPVKLNLWTTVSVLNLHDLPNIISFAKENNIDHSYAYLEQPAELSVKNLNTPESLDYIHNLKRMRGIT